MPTIVDVNGNPIDARELREPQTARVVHLEREFDAHPARGLTPARLHSILVEAERGDMVRQLELADDIEERDGHVFAELGKRKGSISSLAWDVTAPDRADAAEQRLASEVRDWLLSTPELPDVLMEMMDGVLKGFAAHELVWVPDSTLGAQRLRPTFRFQPQRKFTASPDRRTLMLRSQQLTAPDPKTGLAAVSAEPLRPFAWMVHAHQARAGYVTRNSLCRVLAWPYLFKFYAVRDLAELLEIFGLPLRLGKYPAGASDDEKRTLLRAVVDIGHNAAGIVPQGMSIDLLQAAAGNEAPFTAMWDRMEAIESRVILGQTLTAGEGRHGTQALGKVHNEVRIDIRNADARQIEQTLNALIRDYCLVNHAGVRVHRLPRFVIDTGESEDLQVFAEQLPKLAAAGMRIPLDWVHRKLRVPRADADDDVLQAPASGTAAAADSADPPQDEPVAAPRRGVAVPLAAAADVGAPAGDAIDAAVEEAAAQWRPALAPMVQPLLDAIDNAVASGESLAAFAERLPDLVERMGYSALGDSIARGAFAARLAGEADLDLAEDGPS